MVTSSSLEKKIGHCFLVGCPRSGTTLLQSLLASNSQIISLPETHLFSNLYPKSKINKKLKLAPFAARHKFNLLLESISDTKVRRRLPWYPLSIQRQSEVFLEVLDELARVKDKSIWIEKTPEHLRYISFIEKLVPDAKFIHIVRNGLDVVASLYDVTRKHNDFDPYSEPWSIDKCINWWLKDIEISQRNIKRPNHFLVRYENLIQETRLTLENTCKFIGVEFAESMMLGNSNTAQKVIKGHESWKSLVDKPIQNQNGSKFYTIFSAQEQSYVKDKIISVNLDAVASIT